MTTAAADHTRFVRSWFDRQRHRTVNRQLLTLQAFETHLRLDLPRFHRQLRRCYNIIGPVVASCIRYRLIADAAYVALKPIEWMARLYLVKN